MAIVSPSLAWLRQPDATLFTSVNQGAIISLTHETRFAEYREVRALILKIFGFQAAGKGVD